MSATQPRIKEIRQKNSSGYNTGIPIGTQGYLVDMLSNLDLEEELRIGNNHYVEVEENSSTNVTTVKEWYYNEPKDNSNAEVLYYVETTITSSSSGDSINCILYKGNKTGVNDIILHQKSININETNISQTETKTTINEEVN